MAKFEKGQSGNPGGRPKQADGLRKALEAKYGKDVKALVNMLDGFLASDQEKIKLDAWKIAMGYYYGQPTQRHEVGGENGLPIPASIVISFQEQPDSENRT